MSCGQNYLRSQNVVAMLGNNSAHFIIPDQNVDDTGFKKNLTTKCANLIAHVTDDLGKFVGADMRMGLNQNVLRSAKSDKQLKNSVDIAAFFGARISFAIRIGSGAAFAKTVIGIFIDDMLEVDRF